MFGVAIWMFVILRWGPGLLSLGAAALSWFVWQMSGDLDPLWLMLERGEVSVQMRRQRQSLTLRAPRARPLTADECRHLESLTAASGGTFATASYESHLLGAFDLFATDLSKPVLLEVDAADDDPERDVERWIVTPDDTHGFMRALATASAPGESSACD